MTAASPWVWHPHPDVWLVLLALAAGYAWAINVVGPKRVQPGTRPASRRQIFAYYAGLFLLWGATDWPVHELAEDFLFSFHMGQHLVFMLMVPPLLLLGTPKWLLRSLLKPRWLFRAWRFITKPLMALIVFNVMIAFIHWPAVVAVQTSSELGHFAVHTLVLVSSLIMWWPVVSPLPETGRLSDIAKMLYLFLNSIVPTVPASFLTFAEGVFYEHYEHVPRLWGISAQTDQMLSGLIMKIGGGLLLWSIIALLFFQWNAREERGQVDEVSWDDFERELEAWDMRK